MTRFRDDGWPLCPICDEDELFCLRETWRTTHTHRPACPELTCYRCGWRGPDPRTALETTDAEPLETTALIPMPDPLMTGMVARRTHPAETQ